MKKLLVLMLVLVSILFARDKQVIMDDVLDNNNDSLFVISFNTNWRNNVSVSTLSGTPYQDYSTMTWVINLNDEQGFLLDETQSITSTYELINVETDRVYVKSTQSYAYLIYGRMRSNAGNEYTFTINDRQNFVTMVGPAMSNIVIRKYFNVESTKTTVKKFNKSL